MWGFVLLTPTTSPAAAALRQVLWQFHKAKSLASFLHRMVGQQHHSLICFCSTCCCWPGHPHFIHLSVCLFLWRLFLGCYYFTLVVKFRTNQLKSVVGGVWSALEWMLGWVVEWDLKVELLTVCFGLRGLRVRTDHPTKQQQQTEFQ